MRITLGFPSYSWDTLQTLVFLKSRSNQGLRCAVCLGYSSRITDVWTWLAGVSDFIFHHAKGKFGAEGVIQIPLPDAQSSAHPGWKNKTRFVPLHIPWPSRQAGKSLEKISKLNPLKTDLPSGGYQITFRIAISLLPTPLAQQVLQGEKKKKNWGRGWLCFQIMWFQAKCTDLVLLFKS